MVFKSIRKMSVARKLAAGAAALTISSLAAGSASAQFLDLSDTANGSYPVMIDNGWVVYEAKDGGTGVGFFNDKHAHGFSGPGIKLGKSNSGGGATFDVGGVLFAPCPAKFGDCALSLDGETGIGLGYGQLTFGPHLAAGGWTSDYQATAYFTNKIQAAGTIGGIAYDATNGAYAIGGDSSITGKYHGIIVKLDAARHTYDPISITDLGTLGGSTSEALGISKNARYVVGAATDRANKPHAVYALTTGSSWTDIPAAFAGATKSRALAASNTGWITGTSTVRRMIGGKTTTVDIGFLYNSGTTAFSSFEAPGWDVIPMVVLDDGRVVGQLKLHGSGKPGIYHPFLYDGTVHDFGTMGANISCRVNRPNRLGELAGSCIPNLTTPFGANGTAFYINAVAAAPTYIDVNASLQRFIAANPQGPAKLYYFGSVTSIDDSHEITLLGLRTNGNGNAKAPFIALKEAYNP